MKPLSHTCIKKKKKLHKWYQGCGERKQGEITF